MIVINAAKIRFTGKKLQTKTYHWYTRYPGGLKEVKARDGIVISVVSENDHLAREASDYIIVVPPTMEMFAPLLEVIPLQLLAYHIAVRRGCDVDQPRNLAKSVTVE